MVYAANGAEKQCRGSAIIGYDKFEEKAMKTETWKRIANTKIKALHVVLGVNVIFIALLVVLFFKYRPVELTYKEIINEVDINSGDIRYTKYVDGICKKDVIRTTEFSDEIRRLGIDIPENRVWRQLNNTKIWEYRKWGSTKKHGTMQHSDTLHGFMQDYRNSVWLLKETNALDQERKEFLQEILKNLQAENLDDIRNMMIGLEKKLKPVKQPFSRTNIEDANEF